LLGKTLRVEASQCMWAGERVCYGTRGLSWRKVRRVLKSRRTLGIIVDASEIKPRARLVPRGPGPVAKFQFFRTY
jgi:hypothetical protein